MPNWCANRLMFNDISQDNNVLKTWITGGQPSLHRRARKEGDTSVSGGLCGHTAPPDRVESVKMV
ncbi:hypothetical protein AO411_2031025 [Salmonella enterica subsp. enterica serovar Sarajane]|nr:hypothetical protein AO411_2031025 [Salmonella enterica subsp. enterica serovar Sarajane]